MKKFFATIALLVFATASMFAADNATATFNVKVKYLPIAISNVTETTPAGEISDFTYAGGAAADYTLDAPLTWTFKVDGVYGAGYHVVGITPGAGNEFTSDFGLNDTPTYILTGGTENLVYKMTKVKFATLPADNTTMTATYKVTVMYGI